MTEPEGAAATGSGSTETPPDKRRQTERASSSLLLPVAGFTVALAMLGIAWKIANIPRPVPEILTPTPGLFDSWGGPTQFYEKEVSTAVDDFTKENQKAADQAVTLLKASILQHRDGIKPLCEDLMSWGTQFHVIGRKASDIYQQWWNNKTNADSVTEYVRDKFQQHVLPPKALEEDVQFALAQFRSDLLAHQNTLYTKLQSALAKIRVPTSIGGGQLKELETSVQQTAATMVRKMAYDALFINFVCLAMTPLANTAAQEIGTSIVLQMLAAAAGSLGTRTMSVGGGAAGGAAAGGAVGGIVGLAIGVAVGCALDWWMSAKLEEQMTRQLEGFLDEVVKLLVDSSDQSSSFRSIVDRTVRAMGEAQAAAIKQVLQEMKP